MTKDEALRLAWDALEDIGDEWGFTSQRTVPKRKEAITAIKEALAEPEPNYKKALEVWLDKTEWVQKTVKPHELGMHRADVLKQRIEATLAQPEHEPVAWRAWVSKFPQGTGSDWVYVTKPIMKDSVHNQPLYTTPPQRTWVGLTKEERHEISMANRPYCADIMAAHEEELKRRNT